MVEPIIVSIQVGQPQTRGADSYSETIWTSGIVKEQVEGQVWLGELQLTGDGQADLQNHGGPDRVILLYAQSHYDYWRTELPHLAWKHGGFGENLTVTHMTEADVCIGDIYRIGRARIQVSQPRRPCWKLARRWGQRDLTARADTSGHTGWYARVLETGFIETGMALTLEERTFPQWTIHRVQQISRNLDDSLEDAVALAQCEALSQDVRSWFAYKVEQIVTGSTAK